MINKTGLSKDDDMELGNKKLYVKYMVSLRCKIIVKTEIENLGLDYTFSPHGALEFGQGFTKSQYITLKKSLNKSGLVLLTESESLLIDKIINTVIEVIHYSDALPKINYSDLINEHAVLGNESILKIFSDVKGVSVLQFIVIQKIERAKELILYDDIPISEIAELLNYKNKNYLLAQFKKITGLTISDFRRIKKERMKVSKKYSIPPNVSSKSPNVSASGMESQPNS